MHASYSDRYVIKLHAKASALLQEHYGEAFSIARRVMIRRGVSPAAASAAIAASAFR
mgnify:CR=1 FL=1